MYVKRVDVMSHEFYLDKKKPWGEESVLRSEPGGEPGLHTILARLKPI